MRSTREQARTALPAGLLVLVIAVAAPGCRKKSESAPAHPDLLLRYKSLDEMPTVRLVIDTDAQASLDKKPRKWVRGRFIHGDTELDEVGIRLKGHRSMRDLDEKAAFKVRFDKYRKNQKWLGLSRLTLNNMVEDQTMMREVLGYRLYRALGVPAPSAFYAQVIVNGEPFGLYAVVETIDEDFIASRFDDASGGLYEGDYGCDLYGADVDGFDRDGGDKKAGRGDLMAFARAADGPTSELFDAESGPLDMDKFLAFLAVSAFIGDFDGYRHSHNYRIYHQPTLDKWYFIPWGIDRAFKKRLSIYESYGRLSVLCFRDASCRAGYIRVLKNVVESFDRLDLEEGARAIAGFIDDAVKEDERRPYSGRKMNRYRKRLLKYLRDRPDDIRGETSCIAGDGSEIDADNDGFGCLDCDDTNPAINPGIAEVCDRVDNDCSGQIDDLPSCDVCEPVLAAPGLVLCNLPRPWIEAKAFCQAMDGSLARIDTKEDAAAAGNAVNQSGEKRWWIGLNDRDVEGSFRWTDGTDPIYTRFSKGEPDNHTCNQDCGVIDSKHKGKWHDTHCGQHLPFICRVPVVPSEGGP